MSVIPHRRQFLRSCTAATGALCGLGDFSFLAQLPRVDAAETTLDPRFVQFRPEIAPLVRLLEETPRDRLLEKVAERIKSGASYSEVLTALLLAGVRNIQPRPVGFKFHAVLVVNSAHMASQNSPDSDRWLPIFWALDYFKSSQERDVMQGDWTMREVDERLVPSASNARNVFIEAMDSWDEEKADVAATGWARTAGSQELFDVFCAYGARDFRDIGHKAIFVANSWRTLQNIGWQHSEPVLRSMAYALLQHGGGNPSGGDFKADRPGRHNQEALKRIRPDWQRGSAKVEATRELLNVLRHGSWEDASETVVELLNKRIAPQSLWDGLFLHAAEMMMRRPGIVPLHACTTTNALHYAHLHTSNDETRRFLILQNAAFLTLFRESSGIENGISIDEFEPAAGMPGLEDIFADVGRNRIQAASKTLTYLSAAKDPKAFIDTAQRLIYLKGRDAHDYKFSSAVLEDFHHLSPALRSRFLAASTYWLEGSQTPDNTLIARTRAAFAGTTSI